MRRNIPLRRHKTVLRFFCAYKFKMVRPNSQSRRTQSASYRSGDTRRHWMRFPHRHTLLGRRRRDQPRDISTIASDLFQSRFVPRLPEGRLGPPRRSRIRVLPRLRPATLTLPPPPTYEESQPGVEFSEFDDPESSDYVSPLAAIQAAEYQEFDDEFDDDSALMVEQFVTDSYNRIRTTVNNITREVPAARSIMEIIGEPQTWGGNNLRLSTVSRLFLGLPVRRFSSDDGSINHRGQGLLVFFLMTNGINPKLIVELFEQLYPRKYRRGTTNFRDLKYSIFDYVKHRRTQWNLSNGRSMHVRPYWYDPNDIVQSWVRLHRLIGTGLSE